MDGCSLSCSASSVQTFTRILPYICMLFPRGTEPQSASSQSEVPRNRSGRSVTVGSLIATGKKVSVPASGAIPDPRQLKAQMRYLGLETGLRGLPRFCSVAFRASVGDRRNHRSPAPLVKSIGCSSKLLRSRGEDGKPEMNLTSLVYFIARVLDHVGYTCWTKLAHRSFLTSLLADGKLNT